MKYYLAPMEGLTTYTFRMAYHKHYKDFDKYFTPFLANKNLNSRELNEILPEHNEGMLLVPQILTNRSDEFLSIAKRIAEFGYDTVNLNLGCPSGTVVAKKRGSGFLDIPFELDKFLDEIYSKCPLKISIKTRIGIDSVSEWEDLLKIYRKYPIEELIIHPRLQKEFYKGTPHREAYTLAEEMLDCPLCYNGDITSAETLDGLCNQFPKLDTVMIGRGLLQRPWLLESLSEMAATAIPTPESTMSPTLSSAANCTTPPAFPSATNCTTPPAFPSAETLLTLRAFHDTLLEGYIKIMSGDQPTLFKMKDFWTFLTQGFPGSEKALKKIRKATRISEYKIAVNEFFLKASENI